MRCRCCGKLIAYVLLESRRKNPFSPPVGASIMGFSCGIIGLPNVGKSTIFNALTAAGAQASNYPFCTIEPNIGVVPVPDERLKVMAKILGKTHATPTTLEFRDIAGLVQGAHEGKGKGNKFLDHVRNTDVLAHVVRCFEDPDVAHVEEVINPSRDMEIVETELILADLELVERRITRARKGFKFKERESSEELSLLEAFQEALDDGKGLWSAGLTPRERAMADSWGLLTAKPLFYIANVGDEEVKASGKMASQVEARAKRMGFRWVKICGKLEAELLELPEDERKQFLQAYGLEGSGLERVVKVGYELLGLITFYTIVGKELRAWTVLRGTPAPKAAGKIHSDMERGFIKAEVISFEDFVKTGSMATAREQGLVRLEGRDYIIQDGDIVTFRFSP